MPNLAWRRQTVDDPAFVWAEKPAKPRPRKKGGAKEREKSEEKRITLREAEREFGVNASKLRGWAQKGLIDAVMDESGVGRRWMVRPESISRHMERSPAASGPTEDGAMLVPRDAWDRIMEQLGNIHEAGLRLAEARERAAKAETEAGFLRERLAELRAERDELRSATSGRRKAEDRPGPIRRALRRIRGNSTSE
jgi:DNA-binding transcriptional MerR regulator